MISPITGISARASGVNVSLAGRNLRTWTDYTGWDPETNVGGQRTLVPGDRALLIFPQGLDFIVGTVNLGTAGKTFTFAGGGHVDGFTSGEDVEPD